MEDFKAVLWGNADLGKAKLLPVVVNERWRWGNQALKWDASYKHLLLEAGWIQARLLPIWRPSQSCTHGLTLTHFPPWEPGIPTDTTLCFPSLLPMVTSPQNGKCKIFSCLNSKQGSKAKQTSLVKSWSLCEDWKVNGKTFSHATLMDTCNQDVK